MTDKPPWAAFIWHDEANVYVQLPDSGYITKLPFTEGGLSKALKLIRRPCKAPNGHSMSKIEHIYPSKAKLPTFSEASRAAARDVLRKAKLT